MIVKIFPNKGGGSAKASIDYLRGKDKDREKAVVLKGDPDLSQSIAESLEFKNNYTVGCLSFEEPNLPKEKKEEIIERFEKTLFAGLEEDQYNITWIEHTDKNRLELNFFIPNVELKTEKRLQPYFDKADRPLTDNFKKVINYEYGLTNPDAPDKAQFLKHNSMSPKSVKELREGITSLVSEHVAKGTINNQEKIAELLEKSGLEISRVTNKSISIKNPDGGRNIRLDGELYTKEFYEQTATIEEFRKNFESGTGRTKQTNREDDERDYKHAQEQLREAIDRRTNRNKELYPQQNVVDVSYDRDSRNLTSDHRGHDVLHKNVELGSPGTDRNQNQIRAIRAIYESSRDRDQTDRRSVIHNQQSKELGSISEQGRESSIENLGVEEKDHELRRTFEAVVERTRRTLITARERIKNLFGFERKADERKQRNAVIGQELKDSNQELFGINGQSESREQGFNERKRTIIETDQSIGRASESINSAERYISEFSEEIERSEQGITSFKQALASKEQSKKIEIEDDWDLEM